MAILKVEPNAINSTSEFALGAVTTTGNVTVGGKLIVDDTILPTTANTIDIGTPTMRFGTLYLAGNTIDLGGTLITTTGGGELSFNTTSGNISLTANTVSFLSTVANTSTETGDITFEGNVTAFAVYSGGYFYANGSALSGGVGYTGSAGAGYTGSAGSAGPAGSNGTVGYTGSAGAGYTGSSGTTGYTGSAGDTGSQGTAGYTGSAGAGASLTVLENGTSLTTAATSIDFVGNGVTATNSGGAVTVTVAASGGSSGGSGGLKYYILNI